MKYRVEEILTVKGTKLLYVDVAFLDEQSKLVHRNDFIMQIAPRGHRYTEWTGEGKDRQPVPESYEEYDTDVAAVIGGNIRTYAGRAKFRRVDNRDPSIQTEDTDPLGLRAAPGVADLIGVERPI